MDITLVKDAAIDAFILNIGYGDSNVPTQVANAFAAAEAAGSSFKLAFSFDYLGGPGGGMARNWRRLSRFVPKPI